MNTLSESIRQRIRDEFPKYPNRRAVTLPALHIVHEELQHVSLQAIREIGELLELHPAEISDTMSFYGFFRDETNPVGKHRVWVCRSLSCSLRGGEELLESLVDRLGCQPGKTTKDGKFSLELSECLGVCEGAPCMLVQDESYSNVSPDEAMKILNSLNQ